MFIHSHRLNLLADSQRLKQLQDQEDEAREDARPQNHHEDQDELRSNGCSSNASLAWVVSFGHASPATPTMVVILWTTTSGLTTHARHIGSSSIILPYPTHSMGTTPAYQLQEKHSYFHSKEVQNQNRGSTPLPQSKNPHARTPQIPQKPWTGAASTGSSILSFWRSMDAPWTVAVVNRWMKTSCNKMRHWWNNCKGWSAVWQLANISRLSSNTTRFNISRFSYKNGPGTQYRRPSRLQRHCHIPCFHSQLW